MILEAGLPSLHNHMCSVPPPAPSYTYLHSSIQGSKMEEQWGTSSSTDGGVKRREPVSIWYELNLHTNVSEGNAVVEENEDPGRFFTPFSFVVSKTPSSTESAAAKIKDESTPPLKPVTKEEHLQVDNILHYSWINQVRTQLNQHCKRALVTRPCTIFKVQDNIRRSNPEAYTPLIISIGPYHHKCLPRHSTVIAMENHKWLSLRRLLVRRRSRRSATELLEKCLLAMTELDAEVRSCYSDPLFESLDVQSLALVMLLDGCFILHLLLKQYLFDDQQQHVLEEPLIELSK
ncbi:hypothetical protein J5N97_010714 [Dioscorea zingiberensis]|uniref:Uncharacterized protein n=1 Tax=Dioscorea zingiberensis TaxID=325984 RepID=A0A9D5HMT8_9LILI|nr:hypothetical protein J5N97_010714 [Dioscorea zingiberensis]